MFLLERDYQRKDVVEYQLNVLERNVLKKEVDVNSLEVSSRMDVS